VWRRTREFTSFPFFFFFYSSRRLFSPLLFSYRRGAEDFFLPSFSSFSILMMPPLRFFPSFFFFPFILDAWTRYRDRKLFPPLFHLQPGVRRDACISPLFFFSCFPSVGFNRKIESRRTLSPFFPPSLVWAPPYPFPPQSGTRVLPPPSCSWAWSHRLPPLFLFSKTWGKTFFSLFSLLSLGDFTLSFQFRYGGVPFSPP